MNILYMRELIAAVGISNSLKERRMPRERDLKALGLRRDQFSAFNVK